MLKKAVYLTCFVFLAIGLAGCGKQELNNADNSNNVNEVKSNSNSTEKGGEDETRNWLTFRDEEFGFEFKYNSVWGEPIIKKAYSDLDKGKRYLVVFSNNPDLYLSFFTNDYEEYITEGTPYYFKPISDPNMGVVVSSLKNDSHLQILKIDFYQSSELNGYRIIENRGYAKNRLAVSYLFPNFSGSKFLTNVMIINEFGEWIEGYYSIDRAQTQLNSQESKDEIKKVELLIHSIVGLKDTGENPCNISDQNIYQNNEYGYTVNYPKNWNVKQSDDNSFLVRGSDKTFLWISIPPLGFGYDTSKEIESLLTVDGINAHRIDIDGLVLVDLKVNNNDVLVRFEYDQGYKEQCLNLFKDLVGSLNFTNK